METRFLSCENRFHLFNLFFLQVETVTEFNGNPFIGGKTSFPLAERDFLPREHSSLLFCASFLQVKTVTETSGSK